MNATATLPPEVADYLERVRAALAGVPPEERDEMLADLEVSLLEGAQDSVDPPEARLGPPERFAQELRAAAGIEQTVTAPSKPDLRTRLATLAATPRANAALATAREIAPAWWVLRGYVAACAIALFGNFGWSDQYDLIPSRGHAAGGALLVLAGIVLSVWATILYVREGSTSR